MNCPGIKSLTPSSVIRLKRELTDTHCNEAGVLGIEALESDVADTGVVSTCHTNSVFNAIESRSSGLGGLVTVSNEAVIDTGDDTGGNSVNGSFRALIEGNVALSSINNSNFGEIRDPHTTNTGSIVGTSIENSLGGFIISQDVAGTNLSFSSVKTSLGSGIQINNTTESSNIIGCSVDNSLQSIIVENSGFCNTNACSEGRIEDCGNVVTSATQGVTIQDCQSTIVDSSLSLNLLNLSRSSVLASTSLNIDGNSVPNGGLYSDSVFGGVNAPTWLLDSALGNLHLAGGVIAGVPYPGYATMNENHSIGEIPYGRLLTLKSNGTIMGVKLANDGDKVFFISRPCNAAFVTDNPFAEYPKKYLTNVFGEFIYEDIPDPNRATKISSEVAKLTKYESDGMTTIPQTPEEEAAILAIAESRVPKNISVKKMNEDYNTELAWNKRTSRKTEWTCGEYRGKVVVECDTNDLSLGDYLKPGIDGIATKSDTETNLMIIGTLSTENHYKCLFL